MEVFHISKLDHQLNEDIRDKEIRVIDTTGEQLGIMSPRDALARA
ncbi:MAG: translation initiation factor IF-3, partial [Oscillospiraceae bacterium]|nr:translation initiation factor IF-3 [Oscillospiraceae bacterium]